jgi:hypothetical protein
MLKYDENQGGYVVNVMREQLDKAPKFREDESWDWSDPGYTSKVETHYRPSALV